MPPWARLWRVHARERTGRGQVVDSAIYEAVLGMMESLITEYDQAGYIRERTGAVLPNVSPSNVFPTKDGKLMLIAANQDTVFKRLAAAMGRPELADDERYATHGARGAHMRELDGLIADWTGTIDRDELEQLLHDHGVPCGLIYRPPEMMADPHFQAREAIVEVPDPVFGKLKMQNVAPRLSETPGEIRHAGPELGADNEYVYRELLDIAEGTLEDYRQRGII